MDDLSKRAAEYMRAGRIAELKRRVEWLFKMAGVKEAAGQHVAAEHFLEQACTDELRVSIMERTSVPT